MKPLVGYEWNAGQSKQVVYIGPDHHVHELFIVVGGDWQHVDLTMVASAPAAINRYLVSYAWPEGNSKLVSYLGQDGHVQELSVTAGGNWQHADLNGITGAPPAVAVTAGYSWSTGRSKQVVYVGDDDHIHELSVEMERSWQHIDLTAQTNAPSPASKYMVGYQWEAGKCKQVAYVSQDGHIHELYLEAGKRWHHADLSALTFAPRATDLMVGYEWPEVRTKQLAFVGEDGHIHELFLAPGNTWRHADLTSLTQAPLATDVLTGYAWPQGKMKQIEYVGHDGHIYELFVEAGATWQYINLTERASVPRTPVTAIDGYAWSVGGSKQVAYTGDDGEIRELWMPYEGNWAYGNLSQMVMALPARF